MARTNFERLRIYQLSEWVADEIWKEVRRWDNFARDTVGKQLVRAADSIGANIAEGIGRGTYRDSRQVHPDVARIAERNEAFPAACVYASAVGQEGGGKAQALDR